MVDSKNPRKYFKYSGVELNLSVDQAINENNVEDLQLIKVEISFRKKMLKSKKKNLEDKINNHLSSKTNISKTSPTKKSKIHVEIKTQYFDDNQENLNLSRDLYETFEMKKNINIRKPSSDLTGLPDVYDPEDKEYPVNGYNEDLSFSEQFEILIKALVLEIRRGGKNSKEINLTNGIKQDKNMGGYGFLYAFKLEVEDELLEGARVDIRYSAKSIKGSIVSIQKGMIKTL